MRRSNFLNALIPFCLLALVAVPWMRDTKRDGKEASAIEQKGGENPTATGQSFSPPTSPSTNLPRSLVSHNLEEGLASEPFVITTEQLNKVFQSKVGDPLDLALDNKTLMGVIDTLRQENGVTNWGVTLHSPQGRLQGTFTEQKHLRAEILFKGSTIGYTINAGESEGKWIFRPTSMSNILCSMGNAEYGSPLGIPKDSKDPPKFVPDPDGPQSAPPVLNSYPGGSYVIYCDFDGETVTHARWNNGGTIIAAPHPNANDTRFVTAVWKRVSEDFSPFAVNVTTDRSVFNAAAITKRVHCVITPTDTASVGSGGVAYLNSFGDGTPCWAFNQSEYSCADTIAHEVGHTLGLRHDGRNANSDAYYGGHGQGATSWAPIMGAAWSDENQTRFSEYVTQWSKGEYPDANNQEDDLAIISGILNGFGYRADDKPNTSTDAVAIKFLNGVVFDNGIIETSVDVDCLKIVTIGGNVTLNVSPLNVATTNTPQPGANLAVSIELKNASNSVVSSSNPGGRLSASIETTLSAGTYYLYIKGASRGTTSTGFTNYASVGQYFVTGIIPQSGVSWLAATPEYENFDSSGGSGSTSINSNTNWTWQSTASWLRSTAPTNNSGVQTFSYTVSPNSNLFSRSGQIVFISNGLTATHTVYQAAFTVDDHGDTPATATSAALNGTVRGNIEAAGDDDYFKVEITRPGAFTAQTSGSTDTYGVLVNESGVVIAENDDSVGMNFRISHYVTPGVYYIGVRHYDSSSTGEYSLSLSFSENVFLSLNLTALTVSPGRADYSLSVNSNLSWNWSSNQSWAASGESTFQFGSQTFDFTIFENLSSDTRKAIFTFQAGSLTASCEINQLGMQADDHGNTLATATVVSGNSTTNGNIEASGDRDVFRIDLVVAGGLIISSLGSTDTFGTLYDEVGNVIASNNNDNSVNFKISHSATRGSYYIVVRHASSLGSGAYQLKLQYSNIPSFSLNPNQKTVPATGGVFSIDVASNGTWSWSTTTAWVSAISEPSSQVGNQTFSFRVDANPGAARTGRFVFQLSSSSLSFVFTINQRDRLYDDHGNSIATATVVTTSSTTAGEINISNDADYFKVEIPGPGKLSVTSAGQLDLVGKVLDSSGTQLAVDDDSGVGSNFLIDYAAYPGTHYIAVQPLYANITGDYTLFVGFMSETPSWSLSESQLALSHLGQSRSVYITSNVRWTWTSNANWLTAANEATAQAGNQPFSIEAALNQGAARSGMITFAAAGLSSFTLKVDQASVPLNDDGDTLGTATTHQLNNTMARKVDFEQDIDIFKIEIPAYGRLEVNSMGATDVNGSLLNASGNSILQDSDSGEGTNFKFVTLVQPGTYYIKVQPETIESLGEYDLVSAFRAAPEITQQPNGGGVNSLGTFGLSVLAQSSSAISYQWYIGEVGDTALAILDGTSSSIQVNPSITTKYWVRVTNQDLFTDSVAALVTVSTPVAGLQWEAISAGVSAHLNQVAWLGDHFFAVGDNGTLLKSVDGSVWQTLPTGIASSLKALAWSGSIYAAVGSAGYSLVSEDGQSWTNSQISPPMELSSVAFNSDGQFWAGGPDSLIIKSPTAHDWVNAPSTAQQCISLQLHKGGLLGLCTNTLVVYSSSSGGSWSTKLSKPTETFSSFISNGSTTLVAARSGKIYRGDSNAGNWNGGVQASQNEIRSLSTDGVKYIGVGENGIIVTSQDGLSWQSVASPSTATLNSVAWNGHVYVAVGHQGTIIRSVGGWTGHHLNTYSQWKASWGLSGVMGAAGADWDNDGHSNLEEFVGGTQPNEASSFPSLRIAATGDQSISVSFDFNPNAVFLNPTLERSTSLISWLVDSNSITGSTPSTQKRIQLSTPIQSHADSHFRIRYNLTE